MPSITIRHVPEQTRDELALRAARDGKSLQEYLLGMLIEQTKRPDAATILARIEARQAATGASMPGEVILEYLDELRR